MPWLQRIRNQSVDFPPQATFFQPYDKSGGPDILFALNIENQGTSAPLVVLCSIQLKTGDVSDSQLDDALETTNVSAIASNSQQKHELVTELQNWDKIIRVLICTWRGQDMPETKLQRPERVSPTKRRKILNQDLPKQYLLFCQRADTEHIFGKEFADIATLMRLDDS